MEFEGPHKEQEERGQESEGKEDTRRTRPTESTKQGSIIKKRKEKHVKDSRGGRWIQEINQGYTQVAGRLLS